MADRSVYISDVDFNAILTSLNVTPEGDPFDLLDRAIGDFESDMSERFLVPLTAIGGAFSLAPSYAREKVKSALKTKIRQILGSDNARNVVVESTQKYIDVQKSVYEDHKKALLDPKKTF